MPRRASESIPALKYGGKIFPEDMAMLGGLPVVRNVFYVDGVNGDDTNGGREVDDALASLYKAHSLVTDNNFDCIIVASSGVGSGSGTNESAAVSGGAWTFSKNLVTVIGAAAPSFVSQRSRILWDTAGQSTSAALLTISGSGNRFLNIQFGSFVDNNILVKLTGDRNYFGDVHFAGIGDATAGDDTAARSLWLSDADENMFDHCMIGLDTVARSDANAEIEFSSGCQRNVFRDCFIASFADNAGHLFVKAATAGDIDRWAMFENCMFHNATNSSATAMTVAMDLVAALGGSIILKDSWLFGATDWADDFTNVEVAGGVQATGNTAGLTVAAA